MCEDRKWVNVYRALDGSICLGGKFRRKERCISIAKLNIHGVLIGRFSYVMKSNET